MQQKVCTMFSGSAVFITRPHGPHWAAFQTSVPVTAVSRLLKVHDMIVCSIKIRLPLLSSDIGRLHTGGCYMCSQTNSIGIVLLL